MKREIDISKKMTFAKLLEVYPESAAVLLKYNIHCIGCPYSRQETIEEGASAHGVEPEELIKELTKLLQKRNKKI
ncbi:MAG: DUF1858 domain-containing protein [Patescibacteria group bacterium]